MEHPSIAPADLAAYNVKFEILLTPEETRPLVSNEFAAKGLLGPSYEDFPVGQYSSLPLLRWIAPNRFELIPDESAPFIFTRANGQSISPGRMFTDGGSIPRAFWFSQNLSPWGYAPAYLVHDWEFDLHHCGRLSKSFEDVRDTMMEGIRTLMETGAAPKDLATFNLIRLAIDSFVARKIWSRIFLTCPLP